MADWWINHVPDDFVPLADFNSPVTDVWGKDSSAAAIAAFGMFELSSLFAEDGDDALRNSDAGPFSSSLLMLGVGLVWMRRTKRNGA
jgi:hypothetical protein